MTEEPKEERTSRFRRESRFRRPKSPPDLSSEETQAEAPASSPPPKAPSPPASVSPPAPASPAPPKPMGIIPPMAEDAKKQEIKPPVSAPPLAVPESRITNALTVDVKEWFQMSSSGEVIKFSHWKKYERRVERGIHLILALLRQHNIKATFFILGIVCREFPEMVRLIHQDGHEIGICGYYNRKIFSIPPKEYINEIEMSMSLIRTFTGQDVTVHRAPEWSLTQNTLWLMDVLKTYRIKIDSSIYPVSAPLYGIANAPRFPYTVLPHNIIEFPPTTYRLGGNNIPLFGGTYLRILPQSIIRMGLQNINNKEGMPVMLHISPWEMEGLLPEGEVKTSLGWEGYIGQFAGVKTVFSKITNLLSKFKFDSLSSALKEFSSLDMVDINTLKVC